MYVLRRLCFLPLSLFLLSLAVFGLQSLSPTDPVLALMEGEDARLSDTDPAAFDAVYRRTARRLGLDLPAFYFSLTNAALPDTLYRVARPRERATLRALALESGNWPATQRFYRALRAYAYATPGASEKGKIWARRKIQSETAEGWSAGLTELTDEAAAAPLREAFRAWETTPTKGRLLLPRLRWNGTQNRYHRWLTGALRGDFGRSYTDGRPVATKLAPAIRWTLLLNFCALTVVFAVSIPLGLYLGRKRGTRRERWLSGLLFFVYGMPVFWVATLLVNFLATPAYGLDIFPSMGLGEVPPDAGWVRLAVERAWHLILPVFCLSLGAVVYLSRHLRRSVGDEFNAAYVRTALMKGLSRRAVGRRHVLRNAIFPLITVLGSVVPGMLAGSILVEQIFNIPGLGLLLYRAATTGDWPVLLAVVLLTGALTAVGLLLADLCYALADPRVRLGGQNAGR